MSGVTQVAHLGAATADRSTSVFRAPGRRISLADSATRVAGASERAFAELQTRLERLEGENTALRREVTEMQARSVEVAVATGAALQAQEATIQSQAATNAALKGDLDEAKSKIARYSAVINEIKEIFASSRFTGQKALFIHHVVFGSNL